MTSTKTKIISLEIAVQKMSNYDQLDELKDKLNKYAEEIGSLINFNSNELEFPIWNTDVLPFEVLQDIPNIFVITELWIPRKERNKGHGSNILKTIAEIFAKNSLIFANVSILFKEFPNFKWTVDKDDKSGKKLIPVADVLSRNDIFWQSKNYININNLLNRSNMIQYLYLYASPVGRLAIDYMQSYIVNQNKLLHKVTNFVYRNAIFDTIGLLEDENVSIYPYFEYPEKPIHPSISEENTELYKNEEWFSDYNGEPTYISTIATNIRLLLSNIGGQEVVVKSLEKIAGYFFSRSPVYIKVTGDNIEFCDYKKLEAIYNDSDDPIIKMSGYMLTSEGFWIENQWLYSVGERTVYINNLASNIELLALVGYFESVLSADLF